MPKTFPTERLQPNWSILHGIYSYLNSYDLRRYINNAGTGDCSAPNTRYLQGLGQFTPLLDVASNATATAPPKNTTAANVTTSSGAQKGTYFDVVFNYDFCTGAWYINGSLNSNSLSLFDLLIKNVVVQIAYTPSVNATNTTSSGLNATVPGWGVTMYGDASYEQMNVTAGFKYNTDSKGNALITAYIQYQLFLKFNTFDHT